MLTIDEIAQCKCSTVITEFFLTSSREMPDAEARDKWINPLTSLLVGTVGNAALELRRAFRLADWSVREIVPIALYEAGIVDYAAKLRALQPIVDYRTARQAERVISPCVYANDTAYHAHHAAIGAAFDAAFPGYDETEGACAAYEAARSATYAALTATDKDVIYAMISDIIKELCAMKDEDSGAPNV